MGCLCASDSGRSDRTVYEGRIVEMPVSHTYHHNRDISSCVLILTPEIYLVCTGIDHLFLLSSPQLPRWDSYLSMSKYRCKDGVGIIGRLSASQMSVASWLLRISDGLLTTNATPLSYHTARNGASALTVGCLEPTHNIIYRLFKSRTPKTRSATVPGNTMCSHQSTAQKKEDIEHI